MKVWRSEYRNLKSKTENDFFIVHSLNIRSRQRPNSRILKVLETLFKQYCQIVLQIVSIATICGDLNITYIETVFCRNRPDRVSSYIVLTFDRDRDLIQGYWIVLETLFKRYCHKSSYINRFYCNDMWCAQLVQIAIHVNGWTRSCLRSIY